MSDSDGSTTYLCLTQKGDEQTLTLPPASSAKEDPSSAVVGLGSGLKTEIPRWTTSPSNPLVLKWFLKTGPSFAADEAIAAAEALDEAAKEWNDIAFGVTVSRTMDENEANFNLVYRDNPPNKPKLSARAFFPLQAGTDVVVFKYGMQPSQRYRLKNVFLHELGHVFGLRHEFAVEKEGLGAKQFMATNEASVMAYNEVPMIQETDKEGIRAFYKLANGADVDGSPVRDYVPQLRSANQSKS